MYHVSYNDNDNIGQEDDSPILLSALICNSRVKGEWLEGEILSVLKNTLNWI